MFFEQDSSSGVSGDLESATAVASFMEGFWGMGTTVSSYSMAKRLEVGSPGGGGGGRQKRGQDTEGQARTALADRIETNLRTLLDRTEGIIRDNRDDVSWPSRTPWRATRRSAARTWSPSWSTPAARWWTGRPTRTRPSSPSSATITSARRGRTAITARTGGTERPLS